MKNTVAGLFAALLVVSAVSDAEATKKKSTSQSQSSKKYKPSKAERQKAWKLCQAKYGARLHHVEVFKDGWPICYINY